MSMATVPTPLTPDAFLNLPDQGQGFELVAGQLQELPVSVLSSYVAGLIYALLHAHATAGRQGWVLPEGTAYACFPWDAQRIRKPDVSFIALHRYSPSQAAHEGWCSVAPDLAVEVISPNDLAYAVDQKVEDWLAAGVPMVWVVNPETRMVRVHSIDGTVTVARDGDMLSAGSVLPGFTCPVAEFFRLPDPTP